MRECSTGANCSPLCGARSWRGAPEKQGAPNYRRALSFVGEESLHSKHGTCTSRANSLRAFKQPELRQRTSRTAFVPDSFSSRGCAILKPELCTTFAHKGCYSKLAQSKGFEPEGDKERARKPGNRQSQRASPTIAPPPPAIFEHQRVARAPQN